LLFVDPPGAPGLFPFATSSPNVQLSNLHTNNVAFAPLGNFVVLSPLGEGGLGTTLTVNPDGTVRQPTNLRFRNHAVVVAVGPSVVDSQIAPGAVVIVNPACLASYTGLLFPGELEIDTTTTPALQNAVIDDSRVACRETQILGVVRPVNGIF